MSAENAAALAVFAHGAAGDRARDCLGEWSVLAKNIAAEVAKTLLELASQ
jgi:NAD(P)H-hydrate repair Nnr-like enzyme with NAD(P)H-hydrate dehydratase domain